MSGSLSHTPLSEAQTAGAVCAPAGGFLRDPLGTLERGIELEQGAFWLEPSVLCVAEPEAAKEILANPAGRFTEHSDFFHTRRGPFGPRALQVRIGRSARRLLSEHVARRADFLPETLELELGATSEWPDAGNRLIARHLRAALVTPERAERVDPLLDRVLERGVFAGARERRGRWARALFRRRVFAQLRREVEHRIRGRARNDWREPRDLFDVLALGAESGARSSDLGELYMPLLFAVAGSVGFTLGWSLYLVGQHSDRGCEARAVVLEALRLWPIAWLLRRQPREEHRIHGITVTLADQVIVSPYVTHRHPHFWSEPARFLPERWAQGSDHPAFLPFGWGPHVCAAAALSVDLAAALLETVLGRYRIAVEPQSTRPFTGPSLAPPRFRLGLTPRTSNRSTKGGDRRGEAQEGCPHAAQRARVAMLR